MGFGRLSQEAVSHINRTCAVVETIAGSVIASKVSHLDVTANGDLLLMRFASDGEAYALRAYAREQWLNATVQEEQQQ